jgi:hypothetical protein
MTTPRELHEFRHFSNMELDMSRGLWELKPTVLREALAAARAAGVLVKINKNGVEIDFAAKPADSTAPAASADEVRCSPNDIGS